MSYLRIPTSRFSLVLTPWALTSLLILSWGPTSARAAAIQEPANTSEPAADAVRTGVDEFWRLFRSALQPRPWITVASELSAEERQELLQLKPSQEEIERMLDAESMAANDAAAPTPTAPAAATVAAPANHNDVQQQPIYQQPPAGDPYGFTAWLNSVRAQYGLPAVGYDANLSNWANANNAQQQARGLGHHVMGPARRQNSAVGNSGSIGTQWMNSPAHRAALLDPSIRWIGIAGMGAYWTFNAN